MTSPRDLLVVGISRRVEQRQAGSARTAGRPPRTALEDWLSECETISPKEDVGGKAHLHVILGVAAHPVS